jgi:MFS family permease
MDPSSDSNLPWYAGISRQQWLVLVIASLGWVFDIFEGQVFVAGMNEAMPDLLPAGTRPGDVAFYNNITFAAFLMGGALGGVLFGRLSDRVGRTRTLVYTILIYSAFTCLSALSRAWWQLAMFRFLVALGTGGEWAVASALVAEVFPARSRAWSLAIFHASSVLGTLLAVAAGAVLVGNPARGWRWAFLVGAAPALLVLWVRWSVREPPRKPAVGRIFNPSSEQKDGLKIRPTAPGWLDLFRGPLLRASLVGVGLATVGLSTFWGAHIYGKDVLRRAVQSEQVRDWPQGLSSEERAARLTELKPLLKRWEMAGMFLVTIGGGLGLVSFGPLADRLGRRGAFLAFHLGGLAAALLLFQVISGVTALVMFLPVFGFLTLGMHAGYAVYFPELFPAALRGTGAGFCFNVGRLLAAPMLFVGGWLQRPGWGNLSLEGAASLMSLLFLPGIALLAVAPETRGHELPP